MHLNKYQHAQCYMETPVGQDSIVFTFFTTSPQNWISSQFFEKKNVSSYMDNHGRESLRYLKVLSTRQSVCKQQVHYVINKYKHVWISLVVFMYISNHNTQYLPVIHPYEIYIISISYMRPLCHLTNRYYEIT